MNIMHLSLSEKFLIKEGFTKEKYSFVIIWKTRKIRTLSNLKDKTNRLSSMQENVIVAKIISVKQDEMLP